MNVRLWFLEWFVPNLENRAYLEGVRGKLGGYQLAVEFRNKMWMESERDQRRTLGFLRDLGLAYVNLDMPQGYKSSLPATAEVTGRLRSSAAPETSSGFSSTRIRTFSGVRPTSA